MSDDEKLRNLLERTMDSLCLIFGQTPKSMYKVLNETENFDDLIILCLAANDMRLKVDLTYELYKEEKELMERQKAKVIQLWKKREACAASVPSSTTRIMRKKRNTTEPGT